MATRVRVRAGPLSTSTRVTGSGCLGLVVLMALFWVLVAGGGFVVDHLAWTMLVLTLLVVGSVGTWLGLRASRASRMAADNRAQLEYQRQYEAWQAASVAEAERLAAESRRLAAQQRREWLEGPPPPLPFPGRFTQTWINQNVPRLHPGQVPPLLAELRRRGWSEEDINIRVLPRLPQAPTMTAGWYDDPWRTARTRWWDGTSWTDRVM